MDTENWKKVLEIIGVIVAAIVGAGLVVKFTSSKKSENTKTVQKNNTIGGDNAGRDINKK
jgi:amino acid permease